MSKPEINKWGTFTIYILYKKKWAESKELSEMKIYAVSYYSFLEGRKHSFRWEKVILSHHICLQNLKIEPLSLFLNIQLNPCYRLTFVHLLEYLCMTNKKKNILQDRAGAKNSFSRTVKMWVTFSPSRGVCLHNTQGVMHLVSLVLLQTTIVVGVGFGNVLG